MPNHIINIVRISGKKESIAKFAEKNIDAYVTEQADIKPFSFQTIIPRPKSLDIESSTWAEKAMAFVSATEEEKELLTKKYRLNTTEEVDEFIKLGRTAIANEKAYGFRDWYYWNIEHWGTKWDCYEVEVEQADTEIKLTFQTAWSTPLPIFQAIAKKYTDLTIYVEFADEDLGNNCGTITFENGVMTDTEDKDFNFACDLWGYDPEDFKEE